MLVQQIYAQGVQLSLSDTVFSKVEKCQRIFKPMPIFVHTQGVEERAGKRLLKNVIFCPQMAKV